MRILLCCALLFPCLSMAADNADLIPALPPFQDIPEQRLQVQQQLAASEVERKKIVESNMHLSAEEATLFWPIYFDYRARAGKLNDYALSNLVRFAEQQSQGSVSDAQAKSLFDNTMEREKLSNALRRSYLLKLDSVLSPRIAMRFMQLDAQLEHSIRGAALQQLPLLQ